MQGEPLRLILDAFLQGHQTIDDGLRAIACGAPLKPTLSPLSGATSRSGKHGPSDDPFSLRQLPQGDAYKFIW